MVEHEQEGQNYTVLLRECNLMHIVRYNKLLPLLWKCYLLGKIEKNVSMIFYINVRSNADNRQLTKCARVSDSVLFVAEPANSLLDTWIHYNLINYEWPRGKFFGGVQEVSRETLTLSPHKRILLTAQKSVSLKTRIWKTRLVNLILWMRL